MSPDQQSVANGGRAADLMFCRRCVTRGDHCSIVGVNNMGKTAVLRAMIDLPDGPLAVYIDCNRVLEWTEVGFYELVARALLDALPLDAPARPEVQRIHTVLVAPTTLLEDAYAFTQAVREVVTTVGRVVLLLDEFDDLLRRLDARVFLNLRGLADQYGSRLAFITATTHRLPLIRADVEPFYELFNYCTRYLSPLTEAETRAYSLEFAAELGATFDEGQIKFICDQTGGHPGLIRAVAHLLSQVDDLPDIDTLLADPNVHGECVALWTELTAEERDALAAAVAQQKPTGSAVAYLRAKSLLRPGEGGLRPLCPILTHFVARERRVEPVHLPALRVDTERGDVYVNGRVIPPLTDLEYKLVALLDQRRDQIVDKYQIVEKVWGEAYLDQVDDDRIERLVARVREKIEPDPRQPRFLTTVRGRGYRLRTA